MDEYLSDRVGQRYEIEVLDDNDQSFYIKIKNGDAYIGQLLCSFRPGNIMILDDLFIRNDIEPVENWGTDRKNRPGIYDFPVDIMPGDRHKIRWESGPVEIDYRNRGLGSALLELVKKVAKERKIETIYGSIVKKDLMRNRGLIRWYWNRGFNLTGPFEGCIKEAEAYIRFAVITG
jgi:hypothetical protein